VAKQFWRSEEYRWTSELCDGHRNFGESCRSSRLSIRWREGMLGGTAITSGFALTSRK
jgi:hypothetical protein